MNRIPKVAVILESSHQTARSMIMGILDYVREHGPWDLRLMPGGGRDLYIPSPEVWPGDGIIARIPSDRTARDIVASGLPTVLIDPQDAYLEATSPLARFSSVSCDSIAVGNMAADWFLGLGYTSFAFVGSLPARDWAIRRRKAFAARLAGFKCAAYNIRRHAVEAGRPSLERWLGRLAHGTALFAENDEIAREVLNAAMEAGLRVPDDLAVLGVNDDPLTCETSLPKLSSIRRDTRRAGYVAAKLLARHMRNPHAERRMAFFRPLEIVERQSAGIVHAEDPLVADAMKLVYELGANGVRVTEIAAHLGVTVRTLEHHMVVSGISLKNEIARRRLAAVDKLVRSSSLPLAEIARRCGFATVPYFSTVYRRTFGVTPGTARNCSTR